MTTKWNWQKIVVPGTKQLNLPDFKKSVLLIEKRDGKFYGVVGSLETLDIDGPHWSTGTNLFAEIFGDIFTTKTLKQTEVFKPAYWCEIQLPQENEMPETDGKGG
jgi:hypothetical protein